jgi:D-3-phosphoglycerate dehydrogenase / 2-oxoglutarate reductase
MKPGSFLINAARGDLVDYEAVREALDTGQLGGAMVDVYTDEEGGVTEPAKKGDTFEHVLRGHEKVTLLPHIGGSTKEAQRNIGKTVASKSIAYLQTGNSMGAVNIPNLPLGPLSPGIGRLLHIHDNEPGVMAELGELIAGVNLNVATTSQKAESHIGYAAFDIEGQIPEELVKAAADTILATRRVRAISADYN